MPPVHFAMVISEMWFHKLFAHAGLKLRVSQSQPLKYQESQGLATGTRPPPVFNVSTLVLSEGESVEHHLKTLWSNRGHTWEVYYSN
jgi:hypothetical protein